MEQTTFQIAEMPNYTFRPKKLRAVEINALGMAMDLDDIERTIKTYDYCLEHIEVEIKGEWIPVKKNNDYWPATLEDDVVATKQLVTWFLENVVFKVFQKSSE